MTVFLADFAATIPSDSHAVMVLDQAGWHDAWALRVPDNVTLVPLPPCCPGLNPVERLWLHLRERFLSQRSLADLDAVITACCNALNAVASEPERIRSVTAYPYIQQVNAE